MKNPVYYRTSGLLILLNFILIFATSGWDQLRFVNTLFLTGIILLMIGALTLIIQGGFFTVFIGGFKKVMSAPEELSPKIDPQKVPQKLEFPWKTWISPVCFTVGLINTLLSFLLLF